MQDTLACAGPASRCAHAAPSRGDSRSVDAVACPAVAASLSGRLALPPLPLAARYSHRDGIVFTRRLSPKSFSKARSVDTSACRSWTAGSTPRVRLAIKQGPSPPVPANVFRAFGRSRCAVAHYGRVARGRAPGLVAVAAW